MLGDISAAKCGVSSVCWYMARRSKRTGRLDVEEDKMPTYTQQHRLLEITTPLGPDVLLLKGFSGFEAISQLFHFQLDLLAKKEDDVPFDKLLGQKITVRLTLPSEKERYFSGIINKIGRASCRERV